jgi:hypothetical protein
MPVCTERRHYRWYRYSRERVRVYGLTCTVVPVVVESTKRCFKVQCRENESVFPIKNIVTLVANTVHDLQHTIGT